MRASNFSKKSSRLTLSIEVQRLFIMAKGSQRRSSQHERSQASCVWHLIRKLELRWGRSSRQLLVDRKQVGKQVVGPGHLITQKALPRGTKKCENVADADESKVPMADAVKTSVKDLMEAEMLNEQCSKKQPNDLEINLGQIRTKYENRTKTNRKRRSRSCIKSRDTVASELDAPECLPENLNQVSEHKPSDDVDLEKLMEELAQIIQGGANLLKGDFPGDLETPSGQAYRVVDEKLAAAIKLVIEGRSRNGECFGEEGDTFSSKDFMDALHTLNLNQGLFLKLLENPNSVLVKQIEDARVDKDQILSSLSWPNVSKEKPVNLKSDEFGSHKHQNFFQRRTKSLGCYPLGGDKDSQSSNKLVNSKPGSGGTQSPKYGALTSNFSLQSYYMGNQLLNDQNASYFSFTKIKRKLRHAMGKEIQGIPPHKLILELPPKHQHRNKGDKVATGETFGWSSPNRNHFFIEKFTTSLPSFRKGVPVRKLKDKGSIVVNETCQRPQLGESNIYIEAKKHMSEMLMSGDENAELLTGQLPKSLGRILSLPEYNGPPSCSPRQPGNDSFVNGQMMLSPCGITQYKGHLQENKNDLPNPRRQNLESRPCISGIITADKAEPPNMKSDTPKRDDLKCPLEVQSVAQDIIVPEEIEEMKELKPQEEKMFIHCSSESSSTSIGGDSEKGGFREVDNEKSASQFLKESSLCFKTQAGKSKMARQTKKMEKPSPTSILEPLFTDDDISPASTICQPAEKQIQPWHIHFEEQSCTSEQGICSRISLEDEESAFEYVEAVLFNSGLNWDEFLLRWLSSCEILDLSEFGEVELFSSQPRCVQKLLFDCTNESLKEVCEDYFGCFTGMSRGKLNIRPVPTGVDLIHELWKRVEGHLFLRPHSLDQLVKMDLERHEQWMNIQSDVELGGFEMGDAIFNELVDDIVMSFVDDAPEVEFSCFKLNPLPSRTPACRAQPNCFNQPCQISQLK